MTPSVLLTTREVADRLGVTPRTIRTWVRRGIIPECYINHVERRFVLDDVMLALRERRSQGGNANG